MNVVTTAANPMITAAAAPKPTAVLSDLVEHHAHRLAVGRFRGSRLKQIEDAPRGDLPRLEPKGHVLIELSNVKERPEEVAAILRRYATEKFHVPR